MPTIYLCGGIAGLSDAEAKGWREKAKLQLSEFQIFDPMRRDYRGKEDQNVNEIVGQDMDEIKRSDALLVNAARPSWGTAMEIAYAKMWGKETYAFVGFTPSISPWLRYHCTSIDVDMTRAINRLKMSLFIKFGIKLEE